MPGHARDTVAFPISENHKRVLRNSGRDYRDPHVRFQPATPALDLALGKNAQLSRNDPRADLLLKAKEAARDGLERFLKIAGVAILSLGGSTFSVAQPPVGPFRPSGIDLLTIDEVPLPTARQPVVLTEAPEIDWHFVPNEIAEITALAPSPVSKTETIAPTIETLAPDTLEVTPTQMALGMFGLALLFLLWRINVNTRRTFLILNTSKKPTTKADDQPKESETTIAFSCSTYHRRTFIFCCVELGCVLKMEIEADECR